LCELPLSQRIAVADGACCQSSMLLFVNVIELADDDPKLSSLVLWSANDIAYS